MNHTHQLFEVRLAQLKNDSWDAEHLIVFMRECACRDFYAEPLALMRLASEAELKLPTLLTDARWHHAVMRQIAFIHVHHTSFNGPEIS